MGKFIKLMKYYYKEGDDFADWYALNTENNKYLKTHTSDGALTITEETLLPSGTTTITKSEYENTLCAAIYAYANPSGAGLRIGTRPTIVIR